MFQIAREKSCDYLLIIYVQKSQTNNRQFVLILPCGVNTLRLQESDWSKNDNTGLLTCLRNTDPKYPLRKKNKCLNQANISLANFTHPNRMVPSASVSEPKSQLKLAFQSWNV